MWSDYPCEFSGRRTDPTNGYVRVTDRGKRRYQHQVVFEQAGGVIPLGWTIDHLCGVRSCRRIEHLEAVTRAENCRRGHLRMTHCKRGHSLADALIRKNGSRLCRTCTHWRQWFDRRGLPVDWSAA